jgi:hypothetical protein
MRLEQHAKGEKHGQDQLFSWVFTGAGGRMLNSHPEATGWPENKQFLTWRGEQKGKSASSDAPWKSHDAVSGGNKYFFSQGNLSFQSKFFVTHYSL